MRTVLLTERVGSDCRLAPADVEFLLAEHRAHLELTPTRQRGSYRMTPTGHVGTILGPKCRFLIRPKIPVGNLFHLLDPMGPLPVLEDRTAAEAAPNLLDFLAGRLAMLLTERAAAGLHRTYAERSDAGPFLLGRLDLPAQLRGANGRKDRLHCRYEEFTSDVPCNQVPKTTATRVLMSPLLGDTARAALQTALQAFAEVRTVPLGSDTFAEVLTDRLAEAYRPLLTLCRLLADGLAAGKTSGLLPTPAFLLDMERVFEGYVTQGVRDGYAESLREVVRVQPLYAANRPMVGQPDLQLRPDLLIERGGRPVLAIDAKWKALAGSPLVTADVYQMLAYCTALGVRRGVLVYPGRRNRVWHYPLARVPIHLEIRLLRVTGSRATCRRSLQRLIGKLRGTDAARRG
jgi:5-methylcytosine-specific restriction enzyme subunit McrC